MDETTTTIPMLVFDADRLWQALGYHLTDYSMPFWSKVDGITTDSLALLHRRLARRPGAVLLRQEKWAGFTDQQRLLWLLEVTHTDGQYLPGTRTIELVEADDE